jgi:hypothetical protein
MEKPDTLPSPANSQPPVSTSSRPMARIKQYWDLLAVMLVALAAAPLAWLSPRTLFIVPHPGSFDDNWVLDTGFKASRGIWFGRDWDDADLTRYFDADEGHWRTNQRPAITQLRLLFTPFDWVSEKPQSVTVESAAAVIFSLGH